MQNAVMIFHDTVEPSNRQQFSFCVSKRYCENLYVLLNYCEA